LQYELDWFFGGKPQRGWYLYAPLIRHLIGTDGEAGSDRFAERLSRWQRQAGLPAAGVLERETWSKMVAVFQARRLKSREVPSAEKLFQAPAGEFYDHSRPAELRFVEPQAYAAYQRMLAAAAADPALQPAGRDHRLAPAGEFLKIISAFRSPAYQAGLRERNPKSGRAGLAVNSPHFTGRALDLYVGGEPVSTADRNRAVQINTPVYQWLVQNAGRFGFYPYFYEPWHWEFCGQ
jgi:LAS superfamily LD-carboxypeptidase LdcB